MKIKIKTKAFTLVELLLVVGIIALGSVVAYITLPKVQATMRANKEIVNINTMAAGLRNMFAGKNDYSQLEPGTVTAETVAIRGKAAPDNWLHPTMGLANTFGGQIYLNGNPAAVGLPGHFRIMLQGVPDNECAKIIPGILDSFTEIGITPYGQGYSAATTVKSKTIAYAPDKAITLCSNNDNNQLHLIGK